MKIFHDIKFQRDFCIREQGWTPRPQDRINMARNQHYPQHHQQQQMQHQMPHHHGSHRQPYNYQHVPYQGYQYGDHDAGGQGYPPYEGGYGGNYNRQHVNVDNH